MHQISNTKYMLTNKPEIVENDLNRMVFDHYDNPTLMSLEGEICFDDELSRAEVDVVLNTFRKFTSLPVPKEVYVPCAGTLRHIPALIEQGVERVVAVDLSYESLKKGFTRYPGISAVTSIYNTDIRNYPQFLDHRVPLVFLMGNSFGDVTNYNGHLEFIEALVKPLDRGGLLVFDYVGDRYCPPEGTVLETEWPDRITNSFGVIDVIDRRSRRYRATSNGMGILDFTCEVIDPNGKAIVPQHTYSKLVVPDNLLKKQFKLFDVKLYTLGPISLHPSYHSSRIKDKDDLGMMGKPDHLYVGVKE